MELIHLCVLQYFEETPVRDAIKLKKGPFWAVGLRGSREVGPGDPLVHMIYE